MSGLRVRTKLRPARIAPGRGRAEPLAERARKVEPYPSNAAMQLALAHYIERLIEAGGLRDQAEAARRLGLTRARLTQLLDLALVSPRIQEAVLLGKWKPRGGRALRPVMRRAAWEAEEKLVPCCTPDGRLRDRGRP